MTKDMADADLASAQNSEQEYDAWSQAASDVSDDGDDDHIVEDDQLAGVDSKTINTNMLPSYKPDWSPWEGFRELFQNW